MKHELELPQAIHKQAQRLLKQLDEDARSLAASGDTLSPAERQSGLEKFSAAATAAKRLLRGVAGEGRDE